MTARVDYAKHVVFGTSGYGKPPPAGKIAAWLDDKGLDPKHAFAVAKKIQKRGTWGESGNIVGNNPYDGKPRNWLTEALKEASR